MGCGYFLFRHAGLVLFRIASPRHKRLSRDGTGIARCRRNRVDSFGSIIATRRANRKARRRTRPAPQTDPGMTMPRVAHISRKTAETAIDLDLNLDGSGKVEVSTGI